MNERTINKNKDSTNSGFLYRQVFQTKLSLFVVLVLLTSFIIQPIERVSADEVFIEDAPASAQEVVVAEIPPAPVSEPVSLETLIIETENDTSDTVDTVDAIDVEDAVDETSLLTPPVSEESESVIVVPLEPEASTTADTTTVEETIELPDTVIDETIAEYTPTTPPLHNLQTDESGNVVTPPDPAAVIDTPIIEANATATVLANSVTAVSTVSSDGVIQFEKNDCVVVADGSFYCQPQKADTELSTDGFYALPDRDGDLEIYIQKAGVLEQLTFNDVDDAAPYFDSVSNTIVWHRLVSDRYQIVEYSVATGDEIQITSDSVNNMEPTRSGRYTVWQRWSGNNWDIVLYDGKNTTILTTALEHDVAPKVRGDLVVWNRLAYDRAQTIELYDIQTGEYTTISDTEGGIISNPRMVLVYESAFANGDVITKGYDIETGKITPLSALPAQIPDELPTPDSTGETRALIQAKPLTEEEVESGAIGTTTPVINPPEVPVQEIMETIATTTVFASSTTFATELTLDLRPVEAANPSPITDVIVPVFIASTSEATMTE
jgi:hypothetical protein